MITKSGIAVTALVAGMAMTFTNGAAAEGGYVSLMGGYSTLDSTIKGERDDINDLTNAVTLKDSFIGGIALGYSFKDPWRIEAEATYQNFDIDQIRNDNAGSPGALGTFSNGSGDIDAIGLTANVFYDYKTSGTSLAPYIGLGLGAIYVEANNVQKTGRSTLNDSAVAPMALAMVGVGYDLTKEVNLNVGYRLQGIGVLSGSQTRANGTVINADTNYILIHSVTAGLRFSF